MREEIERFPAEKRQIRFEEPPELIFFDVDEEQEEADFISVDDLFRITEEEAKSRCQTVRFTLFPDKKGQYIDSRLSRVIHRTLALSSLQLEKPLEKVRVRPAFIQWQLELGEEEETEPVAREFRTDLELQIHNYKDLDEGERFWAVSCLICPADTEITDDALNRIIPRYQQP